LQFALRLLYRLPLKSIRLPTPSSDRGRVVALGTIIVVASLLVYLPALQSGFIWDDDNYVTANQALTSLDGLRRIWIEPGAVPQYYPLTFTSFWVEYRLWDLQPLGYHLVNVLLHALNALLFWRLLRVLEIPGAWLAAAVFALHPMHVESVAWITERKNVLSGACYLGAALAYLRFAPPLEPRSDAQGVRWAWYGLAFLLFTGALLSKTVTASLPAALLLVLWWKRERIGWRDVVPLIPFFIVGLSAAAMTVLMERTHVGAQGADWAFSPVEHVLIAGRIVWFYLWALVWPSNLTFIYPRWQIDAGLWWQYLFPLFGLGALAMAFMLRQRLGKGPLVAALLYVGTLVPALGLFNVYPMRYSFVADHFAYLANLVVIAAGTALAARMAEAFRLEPSTQHRLAAAVLVLLGILTWQQAHIYHDAEALWSDTVAKNPEGWVGLVNLGGVLADQGRLDEAIAYMESAGQRWPGSPEVHNALGAMWDQQGRFDDALAAFEEALRLEPRYYEAHTNIGIVLTTKGRYAEALEHLFTAVRLKPEYSEASYHLATALRLMGRYTEAAKYYASALLLDPGRAEAHNGLCMVQLEQGRAADAGRHCGEAIRLNEQYPEAYENLARALRMQGRLDEGAALEKRASSLRQQLAEAHRNSGVILAEQGKPKAAIAHLREALRFAPDDATTEAQLQRVLGRDS
jgi:tetratricopeptide (TPR) repeat protein